ncbi:unnamed protein product [Ixodes pacificus]
MSFAFPGVETVSCIFKPPAATVPFCEALKVFCFFHVSFSFPVRLLLNVFRHSAGFCILSRRPHPVLCCLSATAANVLATAAIFRLVADDANRARCCGVSFGFAFKLLPAFCFPVCKFFSSIARPSKA